MQFSKVQLHLFGILLAITVTMVVTQVNETSNDFPTHPLFEFPPLNRSTMLRAKAMLRWLINNRTENNTRTFNAGFIRLIFHDCVGGCDGCVNLLNPSNTGLGFYKLPLDLMYRDFIFPWMSRADWYALAGLTAVEFAAELTPCEGKNCKQHKPDLNFLYGRRDCVSEGNTFRFIPGPTLDPRFTIRNTFRLNFAEITALMGAHCLGKNHQKDTRWVDDGTKFNNQYYKDMLADHRNWKRGNGTSMSEWTSESTGNVMLSSDMFMAFDVSNTDQCTGDPMKACNKTNTFQLVQMFAEDNEFWMREFSVAFNVMLMNGNFGRLKLPVLDTLDTEWQGDIADLLPDKNPESDYVFDPAVLELPETETEPTAGTDQTSTNQTGTDQAGTDQAGTSPVVAETNGDEVVAVEGDDEGEASQPTAAVQEPVKEPTTVQESTTSDEDSAEVVIPDGTEADSSSTSNQETTGEVPSNQVAEPATVVETAEVAETPEATTTVVDTTTATSEVVEPTQPAVETEVASPSEADAAALLLQQQQQQQLIDQQRQLEQQHQQQQAPTVSEEETSAVTGEEERTDEEEPESGVIVAPSDKKVTRNLSLRRQLIAMRNRMNRMRNDS